MSSIFLGRNVFNLGRVRYPHLFTVNIKFRGVTTGDVEPGKNVAFSKDSGGTGITEEKIEPVKIAYTSYETTSPLAISTDCPIIIMHGLLGSKGNWNSLSKVIHSKTKRKVIAVDARNHGDSTHSPKMTYDHLAEDVKALMEDLKIKKVSCIGHSMGGRALMHLSLKYPDLVEKLIVVDISPIGTSPMLQHMQKYFDAMDSVKLEPTLPQSVARKSAYDQLVPFVPDHGVRQFLLTNLVQSESGQYNWRIDLFSIAKNFIHISNFPDPGSKQFDKPTLFIAGGRSDFIKPEDHPKIKAIFPKVKFETIPDSGHWLHAEKPVEFTDLVKTFLENKEKKN